MSGDAGERPVARSRALIDQPELNFAIFAFLLNYPWEFLQLPLYALPPGTLPWQVVERCSLAALGDAVIMLASYWTVAIAAGTRWWVLGPTARRLLGFVAFGVLITILIENAATRSDSSVWGWRYSPSMPVLPLLQVGLSPVLQWIIVPPLALWFVRRHLGHLSRTLGRP